MDCKHSNFAGDITVNRLEDVGRFQAEVTVRCLECGTPFQFIGLPTGIDLNGAAVSAEGTEVRLAIYPVGEQPAKVAGPSGFKVTHIGGDNVSG